MTAEAPIHELPETDSSARQHELDASCWCSPVPVGSLTSAEPERFIHRPEEWAP